MITEVNKYLILGVKEDLDLFYQRAQQEGFIEFIRRGKSSKEVPEQIHLLLNAIKILKKIPLAEAVESHEPEDIFVAAKRALHLAEETLRLQKERRLTEFEIARVSPFGDFFVEDLAYIEKEGHRKIQFFCMKSGQAEELLLKEDLIYITTEYGLDYFIGINTKIKTCPGLIEMRIEKPLGELSNHLTFVLESLRLIENEEKKIAQHLGSFREKLIEELNTHHLAMAKKGVQSPLVDSSFFCAEAWVSKTQTARFLSLISDLSVYAEVIKIEDSDSVPTIMENQGTNRIGEDLVKFYDAPSVKDKDPSGWVFWFFALFFAMIISDAGYGLVYLAFAGYLKWKFRSFTGATKRFYRLFVILSIFVVGWGIATASFFGLELPQGSILQKIAPLHWLVEAKADYHLKQKDDVYHEWQVQYPEIAKTQSGAQFIEATISPPPSKPKSPVVGEFSNNILLEFSLVVGIIHIGLSLLRYVRRNWSGIGWVVFLIGGYLFFPSMLKATTMVNFLELIDKSMAENLGKQLIYVGIGTALLLAVIQKGWSGLKEIMNLGQIFGDVLSYVRLYALALSSVIMASTFNDMGSGSGFIGGFFIILAGHVMTMGLGMMSGVIHGLRLNVIEWYHYSFEGGGRIFNPLKLLKLKDD